MNFKQTIYYIRFDMIKHIQSKFLPRSQNQEEMDPPEFETFRFFPSEKSDQVQLLRESMLRSQSRHAYEVKREWNQYIAGNGKEPLNQSQLLKSYQSSRRYTMRLADTIKEDDSPDPLENYVKPFDSGRDAKQSLRSKSFSKPKQCQKCRALNEVKTLHQKQLSFLTKNNQQLYQMNLLLIKEKENIAKQCEIIKKEMSLVKEKNRNILHEKKELIQKIEEQEIIYRTREMQYLEEKAVSLKKQKQEMKVMENLNAKIAEKQREMTIRSNYQQKSASPQPLTALSDYSMIRAKTEQNDSPPKESKRNNWFESNKKEKKRSPILSQRKMSQQIDNSVRKLSSEKKLHMKELAKKTVFVQTIETDLPETAFSRMGKTPSKMMQAKSKLDKPHRLHGVSTSMLSQYKRVRA